MKLGKRKLPTLGIYKYASGVVSFATKDEAERYDAALPSCYVGQVFELFGEWKCAYRKVVVEARHE